MLVKPRNPFACSPLLKKGGVHAKTEKHRRQQNKKALQGEIAQLKSKSRCEFHDGFYF